MKLRWRWSEERGLWLVKLVSGESQLPFVVHDGLGMMFLADVVKQNVGDCFAITEEVQ